MTYTAHQLSNAADVTYRQVDFWTRAGYLTPTEVPSGPGVPRFYAADQLRLAVTMAHLTRVGFLAKAAHTTALALIEDGTAELGPFTLTPARPTSTGDTAA